MPTTVDEVKDLSMDELALVIAMSCANEIRAVVDLGDGALRMELQRWEPDPRETLGHEPSQKSAEGSPRSDIRLTRPRDAPIHQRFRARPPTGNVGSRRAGPRPEPTTFYCPRARTRNRVGRRYPPPSRSSW